MMRDSPLFVEGCTQVNQSRQPHWSVGGITYPLLAFSLKLLQCLLQTLYGLVDFLPGDGERRHEADGIGPDRIE